MTAILNLNYSAILTMAMTAVLIATLLPIPPGRGSVGQAVRGVGRALVGCAGAGLLWLGAQVGGQALEQRYNPRWSQPVILQVPVPAPAVPGHDI